MSESDSSKVTKIFDVWNKAYFSELKKSSSVTQNSYSCNITSNYTLYQLPIVYPCLHCNIQSAIPCHCNCILIFPYNNNTFIKFECFYLLKRVGPAILRTSQHAESFSSQMCDGHCGGGAAFRSLVGHLSSDHTIIWKARGLSHLSCGFSFPNANEFYADQLLWVVNLTDFFLFYVV